GTLTSYGLDDTDRANSAVYEIDVLGKDHKSHEVTIDATNGKVTGQHVDHDDNDQNDNDGDDD
ncbi:PepSY domain-containing protein, partial [Streptomyces sp. NPDC059850]|uniref:PepSY domain-containing protein n=1 Tax=Streptomyces sp. NPDC059850 TaxID=3346970 RepID=UPI00364DD679